MQVQEPSGGISNAGGMEGQRNSSDGSEDSQKENSGSVLSNGTGSDAPGTKAAPALDMAHSPLIQSKGHTAVPALQLHLAKYADMFGEDAEDDDPVLPDTERGVRWSLRTPPKCDEFRREIHDHVSPLLFPKAATPATGTQRRSAARSIHATSPAPRPGRCPGARVSPSPIHVLPQPHVESSTPNMGTFSAGTGFAPGAAVEQQPRSVFERLSVRTPFAMALRRMREPQPPITPTFPAQESRMPTFVDCWDVPSVLEALSKLKLNCYESYSWFLFNIRMAVVPWQTVVLMALAVGWALVSTWCVLPSVA